MIKYTKLDRFKHVNSIQKRQAQVGVVQLKTSKKIYFPILTNCKTLVMTKMERYKKN